MQAKKSAFPICWDCACRQVEDMEPSVDLHRFVLKLGKQTCQSGTWMPKYSAPFKKKEAALHSSLPLVLYRYT